MVVTRSLACASHRQRLTDRAIERLTVVVGHVVPQRRPHDAR